MTTAAICVPYRDRGRDPLRRANLETVVDWWSGSPWPVHVVDDGRAGDEQFSRSAAYNLAARQVDAEVIVYSEADILVPFEQIEKAIALAVTPGLVVPFTEYRYFTEHVSGLIRAGSSPEGLKPRWVMDNGRSIGAVNAVSRESLTLVGGYTERTEGNSFDDNIMHHAFEVCAGPTRWVEGPAFHLYHLPGWKGDHLTAEDRAATARNEAMWESVRQLTDPALVRAALHG